MNTDNLNDTIVAIATPFGVGSIAIVRLSGSNALEIALKITNKTNLIPRYTTLCKLYNQIDNSLIDEALVIYFKNPFSFTGEDIVEFQCHGGIAVANILLTGILSCTARIANPGEFSKRAFLNGKIDLTKAEAISQLISSKSEDAVRLLAKQLNGELKNYVEKIREELIFALACSEVGIDYAEEDLPQNLLDSIQNKLQTIVKDLTHTLDISRRRDGMIDGFKVAIIGKPNVGKSSLLNTLLSYERAIVSDIAGTTRDTIEESVKIGTHIIKIVDTAGIRKANDEIEKIGIDRSKSAISESKIIIALFDGSKIIDDEDLQILELLKSYTDKEIIYVVNKSDLEQKFDTTYFSNYLSQSCKTSIDVLINQIKLILDMDTNTDDMTLISKRQIGCVSSCLDNLTKSIPLIKNGELELFSYHINNAISDISDISRPFDNNQMLDVMFNSFCLGK